ncbi:hypothetical protein M9H77_30545 [Catharanthus roseus]|uniref:Uncharacterized protein n=1 Tax=Catharanthus roseus TaxID=4058 RepID=A0ACB9ZZT9_CATRO|nr:hypothetical protein M9H77_30545 [Catharanthus roseus]
MKARDHHFWDQPRLNIIDSKLRKTQGPTSPPSSRWTSFHVLTRPHKGKLTPLSLPVGPHGYLRSIKRFFYDKLEVFPIGYPFLGYYRKTLRIGRNSWVGGVGCGIINLSPFGFRGGSCGCFWCHEEGRKNTMHEEEKESTQPTQHRVNSKAQ